MSDELKAPDDLAGDLARLVEATMRDDADYAHDADLARFVTDNLPAILAALATNPALIAENERLLCEINALKDALAQANGGSDD